ncbi:hypothetical protein FQR65_LT05431 [Abscondita terminalis]|nr:hypothetical protein FQR65_LT05431 [Abscondita terminalis]
MRDIPKINYNTTLKTKKIINDESTGTLTRNGFKTYKDFLEHYDNKNTKDDQESVSSVDSGIYESKSESTSSLNSDVPITKGVAKNDAFVNGRTGSFRKYLENYNNKKFSSVKPSVVNKHNVIKSEIVIQVNNTPDVPDFSLPPPPSEEDLKNVNETSPPPLPESSPPLILSCYAYVAPPPPPQLPTPLSPPEFLPPPPPLQCLTPPPLPPCLAPPPPPMPIIANASTKKWAPIQTEAVTVPVKEKVHNSAVASNLAAVLTQNALFKRRAHESETNTETVTDFRISESPKPLKKNNVSAECEKHIVKPFANHRMITAEGPLASPPKSLNDVDFDTTTVVPIADKSAKVNTTDPNVKKMVYSTYRGLLGAYNNKANGMIATLPRSMVREDRGVVKQLESIALHGGIEKINGRTNPKVEKD